MIACVSVPADRADMLHGHRITPFGAQQAGRAYALDVIPCPIPHIALAVVVYGDNDGEMVRWFADERAAMVWATVDALQRWDAKS